MGAVAWLTDENMINALATPKNGCAIVVQKEDFLRPDLGSSRGSWAQVLRGRYDRLRPPPARYELPGIAAGLNLCGDPSFGAIRCVGNRNSDKSPAFPRMHNKFLVFATRVPHARSSPEKVYIGDYDASYLPYAVWTGSFNLTHNATQSLENAVILRNEEIASAYANEWAQIFALSEPLDWENEWITPEYRVGT
jgi:phosphatidylserine/phosphatidylglycerophosphate/cardiolipin synthase-like enzyme